MLSQAAWNAFLKTLEEPPPDTVFVLATTEAEKVPATVVDRCHRFDFQRPTRRADRRRGAPRRRARVDRAAPRGRGRRGARGHGQLPRRAGDARAAASPTAATRSRCADVLAVLGVTDAQLLEDTIDAVAAGSARAVLLRGRALRGCRPRRGRVHGRPRGAHARAAGRAHARGGAGRAVADGRGGRAPARRRRSASRSRRPSRLLEQLGGALETVKAGGEPRTQLELALVKAARPETDGSAKALLARIERLEKGSEEGPASRAPDARAPAASPARGAPAARAAAWARSRA